MFGAHRYLFTGNLKSSICGFMSGENAGWLETGRCFCERNCAEVCYYAGCQYALRRTIRDPSHAAPVGQESPAQQIRYEWKVGSDWNHIGVTADQTGHALVPDSEEAFITEHYWGYTRRGSGQTSEYEVVHPPWQIYPVHTHDVRCSIAELYGAAFAPFFRAPSHIRLSGRGSSVVIKSGAAIR